MSIDGTLSHLVTFKDKAYEQLVKTRLMAMTTSILRYNIPDVYSLQFMVSRINLQPTPILLSIDSNKSLISGSVLSDNFKSVVSNSINELVTPTVLIFPTTIDKRYVLFGGIPFTFAPFYLIIAKPFKDRIKEDDISSVIVYSNNKRDRYVVRLGKDDDALEDAGDDYVLMNSNIAYPLKLPFVNFVHTINSNYISILSQLSFIPTESFDKKQCKIVFDSFKQDSVYRTPVNGIHVYKDFMKLSPTNMDVYNTIEMNETDGGQYAIMNVALHLLYENQKLQHLVFYRYIIPHTT